MVCNASSVTPPGRSRRGGLVVRSTTVDSTPTVVGPPSRMQAMRPSRSASTCAAVVGLVCMKRLALGAAIGRSAALSIAWATGCAGTRTPTVSPPAATSAGMCARRGSTSVSGPGQKRCASCSASGGMSRATPASCDASARWTIRGSLSGRSLATKIRWSAASLVASAPSP